MFKATIHKIQSRAGLLCGASIAAVMVLGAGDAFAQASAGRPAAGASPTNATTLNEVVVTAERRSATVQTTPQSITAVSGVQLQAAGITSLEQVAAETPGISMRQGGPGQTEYEMRGMSSSGGTSPTVGFYLDDVALTSPASSFVGKTVIDPDLYDLNRVEVLRGPQGTLYGSSSMGGTIRLITNQPDTHEFGGAVQVTGSGTNGGGANAGVNAMLNIPIVQDKLALRIVGTDKYTNGWIDRIVLNDFPQPTNNGLARGDVLAATPSAQNPRSNWGRLEGARASLLWQPVDNLTISPTIMYQKTTQGAPNAADVPPGVSHEAHYQPYDISEPFSDKFQLYSLPIKYNLGHIQFDSITAYYHRVTNLTQDGSEDNQDFLQAVYGLGDFTFAQVGPLAAYEDTETSQFSQEFRISSTGSGPFQWVAGAYYQNYHAATIETTSPLSPFLTGIFGTDSYYYADEKTHLTQYAGFGEASYKLGDIKLTAGLRYYSYNELGTVYEYGGAVTGTGPSGAVTTKAPASASGINPRINLSYMPNSDLTIYVQAAKGFRPGAGLPPAPLGCPSTPSQYGPDSVWSYEAGEKAQLFDRRLTLNAAAYYENWTDIQQTIAINSCGYAYTGNAGTAHVYGGELEASLALTPDLRISTGLSYTDARLASVPPGSTLVVGQRVQEVPKWTDTTSLVYTRYIGDQYKMTFRATNEYVGDQQEEVYDLYTVPKHDFVNLRLGFSNQSGASIWLFANNVTDSRAILNQSLPITFYIPSTYRAITNQPRTIGVELDYAFGGR